jgi:thioredoxin 2
MRRLPHIFYGRREVATHQDACHNDAMQIACPHCLTRNRVPDARLDDGPNCGHCHQALLPASPTAIDGNALARFTQGTGLPVVADFWAEWCGPCKVMAPAFAEAARMRPRVQFVKVDTEAAPQAAASYGIRGIPTMVLFKNGAESARVSGAMAAQQIVAWLDGALR